MKWETIKLSCEFCSHSLLVRLFVLTTLTFLLKLCRISSINPYSNEASDSGGHIYNEYFPISAVPLMTTQSPEYQDSLVTVANRANKVYRDFLLSDDGNGFNGQVCRNIIITMLSKHSDGFEIRLCCVCLLL